MAAIYKITNKINNKEYIGATITSVKSRWNRHKCDALKHRDTQTLHDAIRKYVAENFEVTTLFEHEDRNFVFNVAEAFFISLYETHGSKGGYNMTNGGDGWLGRKHSEETKKKIGDKNRGRFVSEETRQKISEAGKGRPSWNKGKICPELGIDKKGKKLSKEHTENISKSLVGKKKSAESIDKMRDKHSFAYELIDPQGNTITGKNLRQYCLSNKISQGNLLTYGKSKEYKLVKVIKQVKTYHILHIPTNNIELVDNLSQYCKERTISRAGVLSTFKNNKEYLDWKLLKVDIQEKEITF